MKKSLFLALTICFFIFPLKSISQTYRCGFDEIQELEFHKDSNAFIQKKNAHANNVNYYRKQNPGPNYPSTPIPPEGQGELLVTDGCNGAKYLVPVVIHVIYNPGDTNTNIKVAQIEAQIEKLNYFFRNGFNNKLPAVNTGIQFCLAKKDDHGNPISGIYRVAAPSATQHTRGDFDSLTSLSYISSQKVVNIYVVENILSSRTGKVLGYATMPYLSPKNNMIVVCYDWFGDFSITGSPLNSTSNSLTLAHEMGHYFGLYHPFDFGCVGLEKTDCMTKGDLCCDVPAVATENHVCPSSTENSCQENYNGDPRDLKENLMDYSIHSCQNMFTPDQTNIMYTILTGSRSYLTSPQNLNDLKVTCCQVAPNFGGIDMLCIGDSTQYTAIKFKPKSTYIWKFYVNGVLKITKTDTINTVWVTPIDTGHYDIKFIAIVDSVTDSIYKEKYTYVRVCGPSIASPNGNWYFGKWAGIKFAASGPYKDLGPYKNVFPVQINHQEGSISQSNFRGQLLFYGGTDRDDSLNFRIYDRNYKEMFGSPILGDYTAGLGTVVVPFINDTNRYYIFHLIGYNNQSIRAWNPAQNYIRYSIVDMSYTSPTKGRVTTKNILLKDSLNHRIKTESEGIIMIKRKGTLGYWVVFEGIDSANNEKYFYEFKVDVSGIHYHKKQSSLQERLYREEIMKVSPDGNFILLGPYVYRFDQANGEIKFWCNIGNRFYYGYSFSPDSKKVYTTGIKEGRFFLERYNLYGDSTNNPLVPEYSRDLSSLKSIQIGPDNKLYLSAYERPFISVIDNPNVDDPTAISYKEEGVIIGANGIGGTSYLGLPNLNDALGPDTIPEIRYRQENCFKVYFIHKGSLSDNYSWYFGDGDSSHVKDAIHTYVDTGSFTVTLITDYDTITKLIRVSNKIKKAIIYGDQSFCDSTINYRYTAPLYSLAKYNWKSTYAKAFHAVGEVLLVNWNRTGTVLLTVTNLETGCKDSTLASIVPGIIPSNNIIPDTFLICDTTNTDLIVGEVPVGAGSSFTYQWYYFNQISGIWEKIDSATKKNFNPRKIPYNTQIKREVNQSGCKNFSNVLELRILKIVNKIELINSPCYKNDSFFVFGSSSYGNLYHYIEWQYSTDSSSWSNYTDHNGKNLKMSIENFDSLYVRRSVNYSGFCASVYSNVIKIYPNFIITKQPANTLGCSLENFTITTEVKNRKGLPVTYFWRHYNNNTHTWQISPTNAEGVFSDHAIVSTSADTVQFVIVTPCGDLFTNKVVLRVFTSGPTITTNPSDQHLDEGQKTNLFGTVYFPNLVGLSYRWQYKTPVVQLDHPVYSKPSASWKNLPDSARNKLRFVAGVCDDSVQYRLVATYGCPSFSDPATVYLTKHSDLLIRDSDLDNGVEPNTFVAGWSNPSQRTIDVFKSPDLFNCRNNSGCNSPENAEFKNFGDNYVRYIIKNIGDTDSRPARLYLYWTFASTGEIWDRDWKDQSEVFWKDNTGNYKIYYNYFHNNDAASAFYGNDYPLGGAINNTGIIIPSLPPNSTVNSYYPWTPPNPAWYYKIVKNKLQYDKTLQICLLARVEYCDEYPYKMHTRELYRLSVDTNVINNNNIATHNLWIRDDSILNKRSYPYRPVWTRIMQPCESPSAIDLHFDALNADYFTTGTVIATLDDALYQAWYDGGMSGTGIIPLDSQRIQITDVNATFENIYSDSCLIGNFGLEFFPLDTNSIPTDTFLFTLSQVSNEGSQYYGGVNFQIDFNIPEVDEGGGDEGQPFLTSKIKSDKIKDNYSVYPNPTSNILNIKMTLSRYITNKVEITDLTGKLLLSEQLALREAGDQLQQIDISKLAEGTYLVRLISGEGIYMKKLCIIR